MSCVGCGGMQWGGLQLDPQQPPRTLCTSMATPSRPPDGDGNSDDQHRDMEYAAALARDAHVGGGVTTHNLHGELLPRSVLDIVRGTRLPARRVARRTKFSGRRMLSKQKLANEFRQQRLWDDSSGNDSPKHAGVQAKPPHVRRRSHYHHVSRTTGQELPAHSRAARSFRKAAGITLIDTFTGKRVDSPPTSSSSSSDDDTVLPELGALRAQQKEGMALQGGLKKVRAALEPGGLKRQQLEVRA